MCKVIAVANQKGGVGKTSTVCNLGFGLARAGKKVCIVDVDAQSNLTMSLGYQFPDDLEYTLSDILENVANDEAYDTDVALLHHEEGVDLIPSNINLSSFESVLANMFSRETILKQFTEVLREQYEYILLDCMPSLGLLTVNALAAADSIIIPTQPQFFSAKGMELLFKTFGRIARSKINPCLRIGGILINMMDKRPNFTNDVVKLVRDKYSGNVRVFDTEIPYTIRLTESSAEGKSIYAHDPRGKAAYAYEQFTKEVMSLPN